MRCEYVQYTQCVSRLVVLNAFLGEERGSAGDTEEVIIIIAAKPIPVVRRTKHVVVEAIINIGVI